MQKLLLIRHGQASFSGPHYDVLSDVGREQGRALGHYLASGTHKPIEVLFSGPRARQRDTARAMREAATESGKALPEAIVLDELDEYPAITLLKRGLPVLCDADEELRSWIGAGLDTVTFSAMATFSTIPNFDRVFRRVQLAWMTSTLVLDGVESFHDFKARVCRALAQIANQAGGRRAAVVTSGGPVAMAMQLALDLSDEKAMRVSEVVANTGLTWLGRTREEWMVTSFNALPHLSGPDLVTYR